MKKSWFLLPLAATSAACSSSQTPQEKYNVLFVVFDDLRPELGCYGEKHMVTPTIDAIASEGVVFNRAYVQQAVSAATRASFLTGCRPDVTGADYPYSVYFVEKFLPSHNTIQKELFENGYYVRTLGKIHHGYQEDLSEPHYTPSGVNACYASPENIGKENDRTIAPPFECADVPDNAYRDGLICDAAIETIRGLKKNAQGKPFFLAVGFQKPHIPFSAPKKYYDLYDPAALPLSPNPQHTEGVNEFSEAHFALPKWAGEADRDGHIVSDERQRELRHAYFACVSYVDAQLGKIVDELKAQGLYDNTAIIMIGDHGWHLGDNGMYGKSANFERATRTPFIVKTPDKKAVKGAHSDALVEFVDIYPTICDFAGIPTPEYVEGTSVVDLLYAPDKAWKKAAFSQFPRGKNEGYSVRTDLFRYTQWRDEKGNVLAEELYDHVNDPYETVNIASKSPEKAAEMAAVLKDGWKKALPEGVVNNANNPIAPPAVGWGPEAAKREKEATKKASKKAAKKVSSIDDQLSPLMEEARYDALLSSVN